ncbi:MAG: DNA double-strand break repair nuclease NurA [Methanobacteriaceae archaeon]|nr:DNA double-strand break repair nuclease NurA [Methanobacteriaceae archaeon]
MEGVIINDIGNLVDKLEKSLDAPIGNPLFRSSDCKAYKLDKKNFNSIRLGVVDRKMAFIDGGNQEIIHAPNFSLQVNRVYFNLFRGKERVTPISGIPIKMEFLSLTTSYFNEDEGDIAYETSIFPTLDEFNDFLPDERDLSFRSGTRASFYGVTRYDMERVASIARRFAEWSLSKHIIENELEENDLLVRDGSLQISFANEDKYSEDAFDAAKRNSAIFTGLSKTSHLTTDSNFSLLGSIQRFAEDSGIENVAWCYCPVGRCSSKEYRALITAVKLNPNSRHVFRFEILKEQAQHIKKEGIMSVVEAIAENSVDLCFPGYPYGLIDADLQARVREDEMGIYETRILSEISKRPELLQKVQADIRAVDGHEILNYLAGE